MAVVKYTLHKMKAIFIINVQLLISYTVKKKKIRTANDWTLMAVRLSRN